MDFNDWRARADALSDDALARFREQVCEGPHLVTANIGTCADCCQWTSSGMARYCGKCADERGVCGVCQRKRGWGARSAGDRDAEAVGWLALALRGGEGPRPAAECALRTFGDAELLRAAGLPADGA